METIYTHIAARTGGNIYIGVVGPVRTGKSTLIKQVMETLVIPNISDPYRAERATDELPQSASGKTIMTSEPKFVPEEAVEISPDGTTRLRVRMIDSVGYMVAGAVGAEEDGVPRMVCTPWYDYEIPMTEAAELGTKKVMEEHCTIGLVVTTDGTVTDIPRADYVQAEERAIRDMQATGKPFLVIVNSRNPEAEAARAVADAIESQYGIEPVVADCLALEAHTIHRLLEKLLYAFPMGALHVRLPRWVDALEAGHPIKEALYGALLQQVQKIETLSQAQEALRPLSQMEQVAGLHIDRIDPASGVVACSIILPEGLFYQILSQKCGIPIENDGKLLQLLTELAAIKAEYDAISDALASVKSTGYGIVMPSAEQMKLEKPEVVKKGGAFGIKLKAGAPSIHMIRVDIDTQISPMVGGEEQSQALVDSLSQEDPEKLWQSNLFGTSVYDMVSQSLTGKLLRTPQDVRDKFRMSLNRIVNEGAAGLICLIL